MEKAINFSILFKTYSFIKKLTFKLFILYSFVFCLSSFGQKSMHYKAYLNTNKETLHPTEQDVFKLLQNDSSQIILLGELHGYKEPQKIDFDLLKYLNKTKGFRYYLAEIDYCEAYYFNQFLENGNDSLLMIVFSVWQESVSQWANKDFLNKIKQIRALNQNLPADKKIHFLGVDKIQSGRIFKSYTIELLKNVNYKEGSNVAMDSLLSLLQIKKKNYKQIQAFTHNLQSDININPAFYTQLFGERLFDFTYLIKNLLDKSDNRDSSIYENFKTLVSQHHLENEKFYGLWGYYHIHQNEISKEMPLAQLLKKNYTISSIAVLTSKSEDLCPSASLPKFLRVEGKKYATTKAVNNDGILFSTKGIKVFKKVTQPNTATLFKLDAAGSPYAKGHKLCQTTCIMGGSLIPTNKEAATIAYFQYVVFIRNSKAAASFEN